MNFKDKYLKYKIKYLHLKKLIKQKGGEISEDQIKIFLEKLSLVTKTVQSDYSQNWVLTGSAAVLLLAIELDLLKYCSNLEIPNDFDIEVLDLPIKKNKLGDFNKEQETIVNSATFKHSSEDITFDLIFLNSTNYIELKNEQFYRFRIKNPEQLLEDYIENTRFIDHDAEPDVKLMQEKKVFQDELKKEILDMSIKKLNELEIYSVKNIEYERPNKRSRYEGPSLKFSLE
jgi:hypothetical protein